MWPYSNTTNGRYGTVVAEKDVVVLYQFPKNEKLKVPNTSLFCAKVETFLRFTKIPYITHGIYNTNSSPRGKLPFISLNEEEIPDSTRIIDHLTEHFGIDLDENLTSSERAQARAFQTMVEDHLYPFVLWSMWQYEPGWEKIKAVASESLCFPWTYIVPTMIRNKILSILQTNGVGRNEESENLSYAKKDLDALSSFLGDKQYFMGDKVSSVDATVFVVLMFILEFNTWDDLVSIVKNHSNLTEYVDRMKAEWYPELV